MGLPKCVNAGGFRRKIKGVGVLEESVSVVMQYTVVLPAQWHNDASVPFASGPARLGVVVVSRPFVRRCPRRSHDAGQGGDKRHAFHRAIGPCELALPPCVVARLRTGFAGDGRPLEGLTALHGRTGKEKVWAAPS